MTLVEIVFAILVGLAINEACDVSPWLARRLVRWSAFHRYGDRARARTRAEELATIIDMRPGKLFKLLTALGFTFGAIAARRAERRQSRDRGISLKWTLTHWIPWPSTLRSQRFPRFLREQALHFAIYVLPELNAQLRALRWQEELSIAELATRFHLEPPQRWPGRRNELDMLAEAFYLVQVESVRSITEQAYIHQSSADMFVDSSRRSQVVLQQLLSEIGEIERAEPEPSQRDRLHALSVQIRQLQRGHDRVFAAADIDAASWPRKPARLSAMLRTALSDTPAGDRVIYEEMVNPLVVPESVADTTLLITELLDNAARYSLPGAAVRLETHSAYDGVLVTITNTCAEVSSAWVAEVNQRLKKFHRPASKSSGFALVAILASRSNCIVELHASVDEISARVRIPSNALA